MDRNGSISETSEAFLIWKLDIEDTLVDTVEDAIQHFLASELVESHRVTKFIEKMPPVLLLSLKRSRFHRLTEQQTKITKPIQVPAEISIQSGYAHYSVKFFCCFSFILTKVAHVCAARGHRPGYMIPIEPTLIGHLFLQTSK